MKKVISFVLCLCLFLGACPIPASAEDSVQMKYIKVLSGEGTKTYPCLWNSEEVFCSPDALAEMTDFVANSMDDSYDVEFYRNYEEYEEMEENLYIEEFLKVVVTVNENENSAVVDVMNQSYTVDCYIRDETLYLPLEKLLYLLHADWELMDDSLFVTPLAYTILDFWAIHQNDLIQIESEQEDTLIETGWLWDDSIFWQSVYSSLSGVFSDFDGKIFLGTWTDEGGFDHLVTQEYYKDAILQLARDDIEYVSEDVQKDALKSFVNSTFSVSNGSINDMKDILAIGSNISDVIDSTEDAVEVLEQIQERFPSLKVSDKLKNVADKIENGDIDASFLHIPELDSKVKELSAAGDALSILQCVWDAYDLADTVSGLDEKYIEEIKILQDYEYRDDLNENVIDYVKSSARILIEAHEDPTSAGITAGIENALALLLSTTFQESPQGKALSVIGAVGNCCGIINVDLQETYDTYAELGLVTYSIKVEQLVQRLLQSNPLHYVDEELTTEQLEEVRNQLMLYLKLNLRNKSNLYDLNVQGNQNENWSSTDEAKALYNKIVLAYTMLVELNNTKYYDSDIILEDNIEDLNSVYPAITEEMLVETITPEPEEIYADVLDMFYHNIQTGWAEYNEMPSLYGDEFCYMFPMSFSDPSYIDNIGYSFIDLNGDSIDELLIGMDSEDEQQYGDIYQNVIYDLYTYMDDRVIHLATSGERFTYQLCVDNTIYYFGSSGAASNAYYHYQLDSNEPVLSTIECVYSEPDENWENVYWYHATSGVYNPETYSHEGEEASMITEAEANTIRDAWPQKVDFSLTYFSEYTPQNLDNIETESQSQDTQSAGVLTQAQFDTIKASLGVPDGLVVEATQSDMSYWDAGQCWVVNVSFSNNGDSVASATVNAETGEILKDILMYTG